MKILHIDSSPKGAMSNSRLLTQYFVDALHQSDIKLTVDYLDLCSHNLPHVDGDFARAVYSPPEERTPAMVQRLAESDLLCEQLLSADCLIMGIPMHNWCYPSIVKVYIDHITRLGVTFGFDDNGGLIGKLSSLKCLFVTTRGSDLSPGTEMAQMDALTPALTAAFTFLGVSDLTFVNAQPLQFADREAHTRALQRAKESLDQLAGVWSPMLA